MGFFNIQELREMAKLPGTRPEMFAADFDGVAEALKGKQLSLIRCYCHVIFCTCFIHIQVSGVCWSLYQLSWSDRQGTLWIGRLSQSYYCFLLKNFHIPFLICKCIYETNSFVHGIMLEVQENNKR